MESLIFSEDHSSKPKSLTCPKTLPGQVDWKA